MAYLDPNEAFTHLKDRVVEGIQSHFPLKGKVQTVELEGIDVKDALNPDDLRSQHAAKVGGSTWSVPVYATLKLKDNATGAVVDTRRIRVAEIPKTTSRHSYIVDGQEYQVDNQWQLKPGVYTRRRRNGVIETSMNVLDKRPIKLTLDPESKLLHMQYGESRSHIPLYPLLKTMGVEDVDLKKSWGEEVFKANADARGGAKATEAFYKSDRKVAAPSKEVADEHFYTTMLASRLRPDAVQVTLGKPLTQVTGEALHLASDKMLKVQAGHAEDDRDNLIFKDLRSVGDFAFDRLRGAKRLVQDKTNRKINTAKDIRDVVKFDLFNSPVRSTFIGNSAARTATQINPLEMISSAFQTTVMGEGGIQSDRAVNDEAKFVNPSHLGFLDPIHTPEGERTGVTLRLPIGVRKVGAEARIPLYDLRSHKTALVSPGEFSSANVVLPDQVRWEGGKPVPVNATVRMSTKDNQIRDGQFEDAHYVMRHASQLFNMTSNLIPFLASTSGNRASMASRQMEQAISLVHREEPLVQVGTGVAGKGIETFEHLIGHQASHRSPVDGKVVDIQKDMMVVEDKEGHRHDVHLYNNYPLNDAKGVMHSTPSVEVGATVKKDQLLADTNFSKNGALALGTNLFTAYLPFKGYNFEDGIVISESAAKKLSSAHLQKHALPLDEETVLDKRRYAIEYPSAFNREQLGKLDDRGVVRVGQKVAPGDPLVAAIKPFKLKDRTGLAAIRKRMSGAHTDRSLRWDSEFDGEVVGVHHSKSGVNVHVRTIEPMQVGDKLAGRYGDKGIVTLILPDHEMPHTKAGRPVEVALNPSGVPGRMNPSQVFETAAAKIAEKTGKPYIVKNFEPGFDAQAAVMKDLKVHGLSDTEELIDPTTKHSLGNALAGPKYTQKLVHQVEKKLAVRSGMDAPGAAHESYDLNLQPASGGGTGGQSIGTLGLYALLAHGAKANIREMQTYKSEGPDSGQINPSKRWPSDHNRIWAAIATGAPLPPPKPTFAFQKFTDMLRASGVNMEKKGHSFVLSPLTDDQILSLAKKELPKPSELLHSKLDENGDPKPKPGGLFDEQLTGGHGGRKWTRIALTEPLPNPMFEKAITSVLGLKPAQFQAIVHGEASVSPEGNVTEAATGITGGAGIKLLLDRVNVATELPKAEAALKTAKESGVDKALKKVQYLRALHGLGYTPSQAYVLHNLPVLPPAMRPVSVLADGGLKFDDINTLYSDFGKVNDKLKDPTLVRHLTDEGKQSLRKDYYDGVKALMGIGVPYADAEHTGLLHKISGSAPKKGYFQDVLTNRRQDLTMRSTIVPEPALGLDEVGLPKHAALDLFRPFVVRKLRDMGAIQNELQGPALIAKKTPQVWRALERVMDERPVLLKRDPALHKYSVQAFKPRLTEGNAIKIHPLVTGGFNADFDGDTMSVFVPVTKEAVSEAHKMFPSNNLFSETTGKVMYQPTLESALGLYKLSLVGKKTGKTFKHPGEALEAVRRGDFGINDVVHIPGGDTTAGRILLTSALPEGMQKHYLHDLSYRLDNMSKDSGGTKGLGALFEQLAKEHAPEFGNAANRLKDLGNGASFGVVALPRPTTAGPALTYHKTEGGPVASHEKGPFVPMGTHTLSLSDFTPDRKVRDHVLAPVHLKVRAIYADKGRSLEDKDRAAVALYEQAEREMKTQHEAAQDKDPSNLFTMYRAGVKPGWDQYKQMVLAPMIYKDSADRKIPTPVTRSYAEGLDIGSYWTQMHGARRGSVMKVQEVRDPGYMSKVLMQTMMNVSVNSHDCGTTRGVAMDATDKDVHDRFLQQDFNHGHTHVPAGTLLTPDVIGAIRTAKKDARLVVRSTLKCEDEKGVCQKCAGVGPSGQPFELGTNIGVLAAHAVGERAVQLTLKSFHTGGVGEQQGSKVLNSFGRLRQLFYLPETIPDAASLAMTSGKIEKIQPTATGVDVYINGRKHFVGRDAKGVALHQDLPNAAVLSGYQPWQPPKVGMHVQAGQNLSDPNRTLINPHHLYKATGSMEEVQNHLTNEVYHLYEKEGVRRRAIETVVKAMGNLTEIVDPGDHHEVLRGEYRPTASVHRMNQDLQKENKALIEHKPVLKGIDVLPLELHDDWMAKMQHKNLRATIMDAAATNGVSLIHGTHPIPSIVFGAELGLTAKDSLKPGLAHLKNVPAHHY